MSQVVIKCDLRASLGPARDQCQRNSCAAFAASDAHAAARGERKELSVEYAYYYALKRQGSNDPDDGVYLNVMMLTIERDGQPYEERWPSQPIPPQDFTSWSPPADPGPIFKRASNTDSTSLKRIVDWLDEGRPVILGLEITEIFFAMTDDEIIDAGSHDRSAGGHAVLAVGYGKAGNENAILIRNSWGPNWRAEGHAWLTERYAVPRLIDIAAMIL